MRNRLPEAEIASTRSILSLERFLRLLLLQGAATRHELGRQSGFSASSITLRSQWLMEKGLLQKSVERVRHSKRPVETLSFRDQPWSILILRLTANELGARLLTSTGGVAATWVRPLTGERQAAFFEEFGKVCLLARKHGEKMAKPVRAMALSVDGVISEPRAGIIFQLNGSREWLPCQPRFMHPLVSVPASLNQWTACVSKLHGLARQLKSDDRIAYFHIDKRDLHLAAMHEGVVTLGSHGTSGHFLHQSVQADGPSCYCGRPGCFDALLRAGEVTPSMIYGVIQRLLEQRGIEHLGLEWADCPDNILDAFRASVPSSVVKVTSGIQMEEEGLALLAIEAALMQEAGSLQAPAN